jgi:AcrR family transcriptional regulator
MSAEDYLLTIVSYSLIENTLLNMTDRAKRVYRSNTRQRQAEDTRMRIADAAHQLLVGKGYEGMTVDAIAQQAEVSPQTVYAIFRSKAGILAELLDRTAFGPGYQELTQQAREKEHPPERLRFAARIARHIFESQVETIDLLQGASMVTPELAELIQERERLRFEHQKHMIEFVSEKGWLNPAIDDDKARDILWSLTSRELYSMLVRHRKWPPQEYEKWLGDVLVSSLLKRPRRRTK